ncbi:MAG: PQQ-binding-like beta-propeller repeat protein [Planctomycetaceae bacterium]
MPFRSLPFAVCLLVAYVSLSACGADDGAAPAASRSDAVPQKVVATGDAAADWPQWRGVGRDGKSLSQGLLQDWREDQPSLVWTAKGLGEGYASVAVVGGRIYTTGNVNDAQAVVALDEASGRVLWTTPVTGQAPRHSYRGSRSTPTVDEDRVYVVPSSGAIVCLDAGNGEIVWQHEFRRTWNGRMMSGWGYSESPLIDGDKLICTPGGADATIVALDKRTGKELWKAAVPDAGGAGYASAVVSEAAGVRQYVQLVGRGIVGVRADDGKFLWKYTRIANRTANIPTPIIDGDHVCCATGYRAGAALLKLSADGAGGVKAEEVWFHPGNTLQNHHGGMIQVGKHLYLGNGHNNGFPTCVELATGRLAWGGRTRGAGSGSAAVAFADGNLIFRYQSGELALIAADPDKYELKGTFRPEHVEQPSWAHPVVANGRLYLREQDVLMCYDVTQR